MSSSVKSKLTTLKTLNWKLKSFMALLFCNIIVISVIFLQGTKKNLGNKGTPSSAPPLYRDPDSKDVTRNLTRAINAIPPWRKPDIKIVSSNLTHGVPGQDFSPKEITILHWTTFGGTTIPDIIFNSDKCCILKTGTTQRPPISTLFDVPCRITYVKRYLRGSHAVVFHASDLTSPPPYAKSKMRRRPQNQTWVWYSQESALRKVVHPNAYPNIFNWTMSYRRDSDVYYPYGYIVPRDKSSSGPSAQDNPADHHNRKLLKMKSRLAAWIASNCKTHSKRENFVKELQKFIPVDIFGKCGNHKCPQKQNFLYISPCYNHIQSKYKFYLSFENSLCTDYITEKFYLALQSDMVPVVYGGGIDGHMDYLAVAPENSFIDARKFKSAKELANYLMYLDFNDDKYLKYFEWKAKYQVVYKDFGPAGLGWCNLCQRIYEQLKISNGQPEWNKWYSDFHKWWNYAKISKNLNEELALDSQSKSRVGLLGQSFQYTAEKLKPACVLPNESFTPYGK